MKKHNFVIASQAQGYQYLMIHKIAIPQHDTKEYYPELLSMDNFKSSKLIDKSNNIEYLIYSGEDFDKDKRDIFQYLEIVEHHSIWSFYEYIGWEHKNMCFEHETKVK